MVRQPTDELEELLHRHTPQFDRALLRLTYAIAGEAGSSYERMKDLATLLGQTMALADLYGRRRLLLEARAARSAQGSGAALSRKTAKKRDKRSAKTSALFSKNSCTRFVETPVVPDVPFEEAIRDISAREPALAGSAHEVSVLYQQSHAFALAHSASLVLTARIQDYLSQAMRDGKTVSEARREILGISGRFKGTGGALEGFTAAYAETVYRTNLATAWSAGRHRQAMDPDVRDLVPAFEYDAVMDSDTRPNHAAAHGLVAAANDPVWNQFSPPLGYNCRCSLRIVGPEELKRRGLYLKGGEVKTSIPRNFSNAFPDRGFGNGRQDRRIY